MKSKSRRLCTAEEENDAERDVRPAKRRVSQCVDSENVEQADGSPASSGPLVPEAISTQLYNKGFVTFPGGLPWEWALFAFVEEMHALYHEEVEHRLEALRGQWAACDNSCRSGSAAAEQVTKDMGAAGIALAVYSPPGSEATHAPWVCTGPRFYVSVTQAAWERWPKGAPGPPEGLAQIIWPHDADTSRVRKGLRGGAGDGGNGRWPNLIRGLGWALAPPCADPQTLHADIWGHSDKLNRPGRVRFHHFLWKRKPGESCTTQVVPGGFTGGQCWGEHYDQLECARAPLILVDNEVLHRGAPNPSQKWVSTCSIELCTRTGFEEVWEGCGEDDGFYKLLPIRWSRQDAPLND